MTNTVRTRFFVTKITTENWFDDNFVLIDGQAFRCEYNCQEHPVYDYLDGLTDDYEHEEWYSTYCCKLDEVPPHCAALNPGKWTKTNSKVKIWTRCYLYTPPENGSKNFALSVAKLILDPDVIRSEEGMIKRLA